MLLCVDFSCCERHNYNVSLTHHQRNSWWRKLSRLFGSHHIGGDQGRSLVTIAYERWMVPRWLNSELAPKKAHSAAAFGVPTSSFQQKIAAGMSACWA
ncbi:hypothetical protein LZ023_38215 (plasmid) [Pseudomonas silvicola]|nr:hypothetical protein LZ023_38215 [Pseudomonas silvicola]